MKKKAKEFVNIFLNTFPNIEKVLPNHEKESETLGLFIWNLEKLKSSSMMNTKESAMIINQNNQSPALPMSGYRNSTICVPIKPLSWASSTKALNIIRAIKKSIHPK